MPSLNDQTAIPPNLHTTVPAGLLADRYIVIVFEIEKSTAGGSFEYPAGFLSFLANTQLDSCEGSDQNGSYTDLLHYYLMLQENGPTLDTVDAGYLEAVRDA